jgi:two-component system, OmpR family, aerobic respiration control sensor histidine kinase ArcB
MTHRNGTLARPAATGVEPVPPQIDLAHWAHDLRAAMADVTAALNGLQDTGLPDASRGRLHRACAAADAASRLLDAAFTQISDPALPGANPPDTVALVTVLDRIEARWTGAAADRGLDLTLDLAPATPGLVVTDPLSLERILSNLVGHAVARATAGPIHLRAAPGHDGGPVFSVIDAGPALPADGMETDLGLSVARDLADRIGADLTLSNRPEGGAEARLALHAATLPAAFAAKPLPDLSGLHIVLAGDGSAQRQASTALLNAMGARVTATRDTTAACAVAQAGGVDAMLVAVHPHDRTGEGAIAAIRRLGGTTGAMPVLAVTTADDAATHARLHAAGADGILVKPILCPLVLGHALLGLPLGRQTGPQSYGFDPTACDPALLEKLILLVGPDAAGDLCNRIRADLSALRDGIARAAEAPVEAALLRRHAHGLIALAGTCGASGLHQAAQRLHHMADAQQTGPDAALMAALDAGFAALLARIGACADRFAR